MKIITATDKGGAGKTYDAVLAADVLLEAGCQPRFVEIEKRTQSKLSEVLRLAKLPMHLHKDVPENDDETSSFDEIVETMSEPMQLLEGRHDVILDMSARLFSRFLIAAKLAGEDHLAEVRGGEDLVFLAPCLGAEDIALNSAIEAVTQALLLYPKARGMVVVNRFSEKRPVQPELPKGAVLVTLPADPSGLMDSLYEDGHLAPWRIAKLPPDDVAHVLGISPMAAKMKLGKFRLWRKDMHLRMARGLGLEQRPPFVHAA